ncbi:methionyl-tRNA formyltransferase [Chlamydia abortus]|jgi:phosphoribosylglycinamide formyltransferase-1|uniref:Phosphoribosylglycinamide formyltransferase n=1 Tax=Paenibacillus residui TaxID=629724 RepID=A0ABW3DE96_9BACL|nr:phosphoribosylglycinamide formyltransferase [Aneurinibacillus sp. XH2]SHE12852.1 methionyl-tRNA formyltransferase [Chlamydia abortus]
MSKPFRIAVFASGSGSNFQAITDAVKAGRLDVELGLLVCDKPQAAVVDRADRAGIPSFVFRPREFSSREEYEREIVKRLKEHDIDLVVLAGYMRLITETLVTPYYGRMINIHPSLLPSFPGLNAVEQALEHGAKVTGVTVHYVDGGMDTGPIIAQRALAIGEGESAESLTERIHKIEHELYPEVIQWVREDRVRLDGRRVRVIM